MKSIDDLLDKLIDEMDSNDPAERERARAQVARLAESPRAAPEFGPLLFVLFPRSFARKLQADRSEEVKAAGSDLLRTLSGLAKIEEDIKKNEAELSGVPQPPENPAPRDLSRYFAHLHHLQKKLQRLKKGRDQLRKLLGIGF